MEMFVIEGFVTEGRQLGRQLGFPTANIETGEDLPVSDGVYHSRVEVGGRCYEAMSNLGHNPSVGGCRRRLETFLFGFEGSLYGLRLRVTLLEKIREERKFDSVEELRRQIEADKEAVSRLFYTL